MLQKAEGIVIRQHDYGEGNKIILVFTREFGKLGMVARGAKKPRSRLTAISQPLTHGYFFFRPSQNLATLYHGEIIELFPKIRQSFDKMAYAAYACELMDKTVEEKEKNPSLFSLFLQTLVYFEQGKDLEIVTRIFEMRLLDAAGIRPNLEACTHCKRTDGPYFFSIKEGGILCASCAAKDPQAKRISEAALKLMRLFLRFDYSRLGQIQIRDETKKQLRIIVTSFFDEYTGLKPKSRRFLDVLDNETH
jgi:DNA repair protein RecO (recombination protein O)